MKKKGMGAMIFYASVLLIFLAIALIAIIDRFKPSTSADTRAKAGFKDVVILRGTVSEVSASSNTFTVTALQFANTKTNMGKISDVWTVTAPPGDVINSLSRGSPVTLTIVPASLKATTHTVTASKIDRK